MNKKILLLSLISMFMLSLSFGALNDSELYYSFDADDTTGTTMIDISGNGNNGTCSMDSNCDTTTGVLINASDFDGIDDAIDTNYQPMGLTSFTVNAWVYPTDLTGGTEIFYGSTLVGSNRIYLGLATSGRIQFSTTNSAGSTITKSSANNAYNLNEWTMITGVWDGSNMELFANNISLGTLAQTGTINIMQDFQVGAYNNNGVVSNFFDGKIDELGFYDRDLSNLEIGELYNDGIAFNPYDVPSVNPLVITTNLTNGTYFSNNNIDIFVNTSQSANVTYSLDSGSFISLYNNSFNGTLSLTSLSDAQHNLTFNATNENGSSQIYQFFFVDITSPIINDSLPAEINSYFLNISNYVSCSDANIKTCNITFTPDGNTVSVNQTALYEFTYNGNQSYNIIAEDQAGNIVNESGVILVNPFAYFQFNDSITDSLVTDYSFGGIDFVGPIANITIYNSIISLDNNSLLFEKVGFNSESFNFVVNNDSRINITFNISRANINVSIFKRVDSTPLTGDNITLTLVGPTGDQKTTITGSAVFTNVTLISGNYQIIATTPNYNTETVFFTFTNQEQLNLNIFMINSTDAETGVISITVKNQNAELLQGALVKLLEWKPSQSAYVSVSEANTNVDGEAILNLELATKLYKFQATYEGVTSITDSEIIYTTGLNRNMIIQGLNVSTPYLFEDLEYNISELEITDSTNQIRFYWNDLNNLVYEGCIRGYQSVFTNQVYQKQLLFENCSSGSTGILYSPVFTTNNSFDFSVDVSLSGDGKTQIFETFKYPGSQSIAESFAFWGLDIFIILVFFLLGWSLGLMIRMETLGVILAITFTWTGLLIFPSVINTATVAVLTVFGGFVLIGGYKKK